MTCSPATTSTSPVCQSYALHPNASAAKGPPLCSSAHTFPARPSPLLPILAPKTAHACHRHRRVAVLPEHLGLGCGWCRYCYCCCCCCCHHHHHSHHNTRPLPNTPPPRPYLHLHLFAPPAAISKSRLRSACRPRNLTAVGWSRLLPLRCQHIKRCACCQQGPCNLLHAKTIASPCCEPHVSHFILQCSPSRCPRLQTAAALPCPLPCPSNEPHRRAACRAVSVAQTCSFCAFAALMHSHLTCYSPPLSPATARLRHDNVSIYLCPAHPSIIYPCLCVPICIHSPEPLQSQENMLDRPICPCLDACTCTSSTLLTIPSAGRVRENTPRPPLAPLSADRFLLSHHPNTTTTPTPPHLPNLSPSNTPLALPNRCYAPFNLHATAKPTYTQCKTHANMPIPSIPLPASRRSALPKIPLATLPCTLRSYVYHSNTPHYSLLPADHSHVMASLSNGATRFRLCCTCLCHQTFLHSLPLSRSL